MGEVEHRAGGHHGVVGVASGLDCSQKSSIERLDLQRWREQTLITEAAGWTDGDMVTS